MNIYAAPIDVWKAAFPLIGAEPPQSMDGSDPLSIAARFIYEGVVSTALTSFGFHFAGATAVLAYQGETGRRPLFRYAAPADVLLPRKITLNDSPFRDYQIEGQAILCDVKTVDALRIHYTRRAPESDWPADFADGVIHVFAGRVAKGPLQMQDMGAQYEAQGRALLRAARARGRSAGGAPEREPDTPLVRAWRARGDYAGGDPWRALTSSTG